MRATIDEDYDSDATKTPWILVMNYTHLISTNPNLDIRTTPFDDLPLLSSTSRDDPNRFYDGSSEPTTWGHTGNSLFNRLCTELGSSSGVSSGIELRFYGKSSNHSRTFSLKCTEPKVFNEFRTGNQANSPSGDTWVSSRMRTYSDHNTELGYSLSTYYQMGGEGDYGMVGDQANTGYSLFRRTGGLHRWHISNTNNQWAMDTNTENYSTIHRIWVRADKLDSKITIVG